MKKAFAIIGRLPEVGVSKTRLAQDVGEVAAFELYNSFVEDFSNRISQLSNLPLHIWGSPSTEETKSYFKRLFPKHFFSFQLETSFFQKLKQIFQELPDTFIYLTGTDLPDFPFEILNELTPKKGSVYIGPDSDGGFYFLAAHSENGNIFDLELEGNVLDSLVKKCKGLNLEVNLLKEWSDIDTVTDLEICLKRNSFDELPLTYTTCKKFNLIPH